ncbi:hypothetical protein SAMN06272771_0272 [Streptomyces sp. Ag82_O1-12]|nr:hypothetical protein SAMN06272771_0272 [Streptomyces sp. Ag82_O1-12]SOD43017.1 hypothetical protein SAMN06272727_0262 [Streptomyces sp. Ag82_G6-1]
MPNSDGSRGSSKAAAGPTTNGAALWNDPDMSAE